MKAWKETTEMKKVSHGMQQTCSGWVHVLPIFVVTITRCVHTVYMLVRRSAHDLLVGIVCQERQKQFTRNNEMNGYWIHFIFVALMGYTICLYIYISSHLPFHIAYFYNMSPHNLALGPGLTPPHSVFVVQVMRHAFFDFKHKKE